MTMRVLVSAGMSFAVVGLYCSALDRVVSGKLDSSSLSGRLLTKIGLSADVFGRFIPIGDLLAIN